MNDQERLENQINQEIKILDGFTHPAVSEEWVRDIARSMAGERHRIGVVRFIFKIGLPTAAAAGLIMAAGLFLSSGSQVATPSNGTETTSIWSLDPAVQDQEKEMGTLFADLDFSTLTTQPATTQSADETGEDMDRYLLEIMTRS
jgi:hypothetical protein